ncbi:MAG: hypothetical protein KBT11_06680 [Treponema sp.]|nr:hypothetical protein [Candidatus Treponema equifaecale]
MRVLELNNIKTDDNFIYYRRNYTASAKLQMLSNSMDIGIEFTIETGPLGDKIIYVDIDKSTDIDYPLIPVKSALKTFILTMDNEGKLPCA